MSLQVEDEDSDGRLVIFDTDCAEQWGPRDERGKTQTSVGSYDWLYNEELYRLPSRAFVRVRHRYNLDQGRTYTPVAKRLSNEEAAEWLVLGGFELPDDIAILGDKYRFQDTPPSATTTPLAKPSEVLRREYHDPDNYWRNVWLYKQKKSGATNAKIREVLREQASMANYAPLDSDGAVRNAIDSIARFHGWPELKGAPGRRPRTTE